MFECLSYVSVLINSRIKLLLPVLWTSWAYSILETAQNSYLSHSVIPQAKDCERPKMLTCHRYAQFLLAFSDQLSFVAKPVVWPLKKNVKGKSIINWTEKVEEAFQNCKHSLSEAAFIAHTICDVSDHFGELCSNIGGSHDSQYLSSYEEAYAYSTEYCAYDRELTAMYHAEKYFLYKVEGRYFTLYRDHKPLTIPYVRQGRIYSE